MRTMVIAAAALVAAVLATTGSVMAASPEPSRTDDENAIRLNIEAFTKAANAHDAKRLAALFAPGGELVNQEGHVLSGPGGDRADLRGDLPGPSEDAAGRQRAVDPLRQPLSGDRGGDFHDHEHLGRRDRARPLHGRPRERGRPLANGQRTRPAQRGDLGERRTREARMADRAVGR